MQPTRPLTPYQQELAAHEEALEQALVRLGYPPAVLAFLLRNRSRTMMAFMRYYQAVCASGASQAQRQEPLVTAAQEAT